MTDNNHPITPPPELVQQWREAPEFSALSPCVMVTVTTTKLQDIATQAARWGADQELEACCEIAVSDPVCGTKHQRSMLVKHMRERRRPEPLSLKERALKAALIELSPNGKNAAVILQALAALPD